MTRRLVAVWGALVALVGATVVFAATAREPGPVQTAVAAAAAERSTPLTTTAPPTTAAVTTSVPPATTPPATAPVTAPPTTGPPAPPSSEAWTLTPYAGLATWFDVYDWSAAKTEGWPAVAPAIGPADVDRIAAIGVQTLFIQTAHNTIDADVLEPERLLPIIDRAHQLGITVVAWYLPTFEDVRIDIRRLLAAAALPVDGLAVDIEARQIADVAERNRRVVDVSAALRAALPDKVIGGIVLPPVVLEDVNPAYWPDFPWAELGPLYDVWLPMGYWTQRRPDSGWRDGYAYTAANVDRVRDRIGRPDAPVHPIGGIGDATSDVDVEAMRLAAAERGSLGLSLYDYRTTHDALWPVLAQVRR